MITAFILAASLASAAPLPVSKAICFASKVPTEVNVVNLRYVGKTHGARLYKLSGRLCEPECVPIVGRAVADAAMLRATFVPNALDPPASFEALSTRTITFDLNRTMYGTVTSVSLAGERRAPVHASDACYPLWREAISGFGY